MKYSRIIFLVLMCLKLQNGWAQPFNRYARFDGIDDGLTSAFIMPEGSFTIECYFRYCEDDPFNTRVLFSTDDLSFAIEKDSDYYYYTMEDFWFLATENYLGQLYLEGQRPASDEWTHFAVTYNDTFQTITHFIDGIPHIPNYDLNTSLLLQIELSVGLPVYFLGSSFKGYVDEMRISPVVRYGTSFIPPSTPFTSDSATLALWHFDEPDYLPATMADSSGNGYEFTAQNGVTVIQDYEANVIGDTAVTTYSVYTYSLPDFPSYLSASWNIINGNIIANSGDSVEVMWNNIGAGSITVSISDTVTDCMMLTAQLATNVAGCVAGFMLYPDTLIPHHYFGLNLASGLPPLSYLWSWGDGSFDSIPYPSHTYSSAGFYNICLSIQDSAGCTSSLCNDYELLKLASAEEENTIVTVDVVANIPTIAHNENVLQSWSFFPNPAAGNSIITYTLSLQTKVNIDLYDILGNHIKNLAEGDEQAGEHDLPVDIGKFADGVYVLKIRAGDQFASQKIVVMN